MRSPDAALMSPPAGSPCNLAGHLAYGWGRAIRRLGRASLLPDGPRAPRQA
jgi:hypothetical protein